MSEEQMREEFEAWARIPKGDYGLPYFTIRKDDGRYIDGLSNIAWEAWQASRKALVVELPDSHPMDQGLVYLDDCREAIEAAGITVKC